MNRIGLDAHSATFTVAVMNPSGKVTRCLSRPTSAENLIDVVSAVKGPRELIVEESPVAQWVKETLESYVDRLVVCDPRHNRLIAEAEFNDDRTSAIQLANLSRGGFIKEVVHLDGRHVSLRQDFLHYSDLNAQGVRFKNKLKATYRQVGTAPRGIEVYHRKREVWLEGLGPWPALVRQAKDLYALIDEVEAMKQNCLKGMVQAARKDRAWRLLLGVPGIGPVVACGYMGMIGTPHRFSTRNKLWKYCSLSNTRHISDERVYRDQSSKSGNRILKWVVTQHYMGAVERPGSQNRFRRLHERLSADGHDRNVVRRTVCRSLLNVVRAVWMKGEPYRDSPLS